MARCAALPAGAALSKGALPRLGVAGVPLGSQVIKVVGKIVPCFAGRVAAAEPELVAFETPSCHKPTHMTGGHGG
jgi:hypothetical protein